MVDKIRRRMIRNIGVGATLPLITALGINTRVTAATNEVTESLLDTPWAADGTNMIKDAYPDDSLFESNTNCLLEMTERRVLGPCFFSVDSREDISTGLSGLPMMICLRLVDSDCQPLANHEIDVWHTNNDGIYSADTSQSDESGKFRRGQCTVGDKTAKFSTWFRGSQITNDNGRVNFKSCFPGWYSGRPIHIHIRVKNQAQVSVISQFCFSEELTTEICTTHTKYKHRGLQDTPLAVDWFFRKNTESAFFGTRRNTDGSLLAFKTLQIE